MPPETSPSGRLPWIDHLRTLVILLVVNMHACVTYSHVGDWYAMSAQEPSFATKLPFILWQVHLQAFFMGLLFFVSGYFAHSSLSRRGPGPFLRERLVRLGLPALFYMLVVHPFIVLGLNPWGATFGAPLAYYLNYLRSGRFLGCTGPLWFACALLLFCLVLGAWRAMRPARASSASGVAAPTPRVLGFFALALGVISFLVRLIQPIGTSVSNLQLCFFTQYVAFFIAGLHAANMGWLLPLARSVHARRAGWLALFGGPVLLLTILLAGTRGGDGAETAFFGGWHWQAFVFAVWEQANGLGLSLGLLALFSTRLNFETAQLRWLAHRSFAVYVLHAPVLVGLFMLYRSLTFGPIGMAALLTVTGWVVSFVVADLARRLPGLRAIL